MWVFRAAINSAKTSSKYLSYMSYENSGHFNFSFIATNLKCSLNLWNFLTKLSLMSPSLRHIINFMVSLSASVFPVKSARHLNTGILTNSVSVIPIQKEARWGAWLIILLCMIEGILDKRELSFWWSSDDNHPLMPLCIWWWEGFSPNGLFLFHHPWASDAGYCRTHILGPPPSFHSPLTQHTGHGHSKFHGCSWMMNIEIWQLVTVNYRQISKHYR